MGGPFVLFDDMRADGAGARIYERPVAEVRADSIEDVQPALDQLQAALADGKHVAGFIGYDAQLVATRGFTTMVNDFYRR